MFPLLWFWAPQYHFPLSGGVAQRIDPDFFSTIRPESGNGDVEREAAEVASYGRQLGLLSEVLLSLTSPETVAPAKGQESLGRLKKIYAEVEDVKRRNKGKQLESAITMLEKLQQSDPAALALLVQRFSAKPPQPRLAAPAR
jgi:hypothetical protein